MANEDIVQTPNEDLANRTPSDGLEIYYAAVIVLLRASFTRISETSLSDFPWLSERDLAPNPAPILPLEDIPPEGIWLPFDPYASTAGRPRPPYPIPPDVGFQLVSVVGFAEFALIAFRWHETGEECFVDVVNLGEFARRNLAAGMADTIIVTNLLERLGKHWHLHAPLTRISGLTFIERPRRHPPPR
jgi:hypothetical protein